MTSPCPDWSALLRERTLAERSPEVGDAAVDAAWQSALEHREGCERCRAASLAADPMLLFSAPSSGIRDAAEADDVRRRVRLELDRRATERRLAAARTSRRRLPIVSALAAGVAAAALGVIFLLRPSAEPPASGAASAELPAHIAMAPLVEPLGDDPVQVYQVPGTGLGSGMDVVLVVSEVTP